MMNNTIRLVSFLLLILVLLSGCEHTDNPNKETSETKKSVICEGYYSLGTRNYDLYKRRIVEYKNLGILVKDFIEYNTLEGFGDFESIGFWPDIYLPELPDIVGEDGYKYEFSCKAENETYYVTILVLHRDDMFEAIPFYWRDVAPTVDVTPTLIHDREKISNDMYTISNSSDYSVYKENNVAYMYIETELNAVAIDIGKRTAIISCPQRLLPNYRYTSSRFANLLDTNHVYKKIFASMNSDDIYNNLMEVLFSGEETPSTAASTSGS